jgi:hypothetical protein
MDNPVKAVTSGFSVKAVLATLGSLVVIFAVLDLFGYGGALLQPITFLKKQFGVGK